LAPRLAAMLPAHEEDSSEDDEAPALVAVEDEGEPAFATAASTRPAAQDTTTTTATTDPLTAADTSMIPPCPVTILSGFLGAGKTTLIQYILRSPDHGKRIAVIENEFANSSEGLQVESLIARDGLDETNNNLQDLIELPNGCICCTVKDSLVVTLENLLEKRRDLDYILIECSGLANPGPIAATFWLDDALESRLRLDGIVTLVDAVNISHQLTTTIEASQQIAYADRILLNKIDLLSDEDGTNDSRRVDEIRRLIFTIHPTAQIQTTTFSAVPDLNWILDAGCFDAERAQTVAANNVPESDTNNDSDPHEHHDHSHDHDPHESCDQCLTHSHTSGVSTVSLIVNGSVALDQIHHWLASILWPNQDEQDRVLRALVERDPSSTADDTAAAAHPPAASIHDSATTTTATEEQQIFRIKGILSVQYNLDDVDDKTASEWIDKSTGLDQRRHIVQAVHDIWDIYPATGAFFKPSEERSSKLVIIGRNLQAVELQAAFEACLVAVQEG